MATREKCALAAALGLMPQLASSVALDNYVKNFAESVDDEFKMLDDLAKAAQFQKNCPVKGAVEQDYRNKLIACPSGVELIAGLRFRGLDLQKPFIALLAQTEAHLSSDDFTFLKNELPEKFEIFRPRWVRAFISNAHPLGEEVFPIEYAGKALVGATIEEVAAFSEKASPISFRETSKNVTLVTAQNTSFYSRYLDAYSVAHEKFPPSKIWSPVESEVDLAELVKSRTLFEIFVNEQWAGIFGGSFTTLHGLKGFYIAEIILAPEMRSKRIASTIQRLAARTLIRNGATSDDWFYGTIGRANTPALKSALSAGRRVLGTDYWLPI